MVMSCVHHYTIIQKSSTALEILKQLKKKENQRSQLSELHKYCRSWSAGARVNEILLSVRRAGMGCVCVCVLEAGTCRVVVVYACVLLRQEEGPWGGGGWPAE